jgi:hypothetical protein
MDDFTLQLLVNDYQGDYDSFKQDAIRAICDRHRIPTDNPKLEKLFNLAWDMGHSSGYHEVWYYMNEMAVLL